MRPVVEDDGVLVGGGVIQAWRRRGREPEVDVPRDDDFAGGGVVDSIVGRVLAVIAEEDGLAAVWVELVTIAVVAVRAGMGGRGVGGRMPLGRASEISE